MQTSKEFTRNDFMEAMKTIADGALLLNGSNDVRIKVASDVWHTMFATQRELERVAREATTPLKKS